MLDKKKVLEWIDQASIDNYIPELQDTYGTEWIEKLKEEIISGRFDAEVINTPEKFAPTLAEITKQGELGKEGWWEVVYHDGANWQHFAGSNTFDDGEKVVRWKLCRECL